MAGVGANVPVLPLHDSFIMFAEEKEWLREAIGKAWKSHLNEEASVRIDEKTS